MRKRRWQTQQYRQAEDNYQSNVAFPTTSPMPQANNLYATTALMQQFVQKQLQKKYWVHKKNLEKCGSSQKYEFYDIF